MGLYSVSWLIQLILLMLVWFAGSWIANVLAAITIAVGLSDGAVVGLGTWLKWSPMVTSIQMWVIQGIMGFLTALVGFDVWLAFIPASQDLVMPIVTVGLIEVAIVLVVFLWPKHPRR